MTEARADYRDRMLRECRRFSFFGIKPQWRPGEGDVDGFIHDEVVRQGHDPRVKDDGGNRVRWMTEAWEYATERVGRFPDTHDIKVLGALVEQKKNAGGFRGGFVRVGSHLAPAPRLVPILVPLLAAQAQRVAQGPADVTLFKSHLELNFTTNVEKIATTDDWYLGYEWIHPFADGNGRSGKVLVNWLRGTLDEPYLPPDYFGGGNP